MKKAIKSLLVLSAFLLNTSIAYAQQVTKIKEYSKIVDQVVNGDNAAMSKISILSDEINCQLTKKQAKECGLVNFSELRIRSCGSADFPEKEVYTNKDIVLYNNSLNKLKKHFAPK